jgi:hypothetical protein
MRCNCCQHFSLHKISPRSELTQSRVARTFRGASLDSFGNFVLDRDPPFSGSSKPGASASGIQSREHNRSVATIRGLREDWLRASLSALTWITRAAAVSREISLMFSPVKITDSEIRERWQSRRTGAVSRLQNSRNFSEKATVWFPSNNCTFCFENYFHCVESHWQWQFLLHHRDRFNGFTHSSFRVLKKSILSVDIWPDHWNSSPRNERSESGIFTRID